MTNPNDSIHPDTKENPQFNHPHFGLTKREHFAAMAMQGIVSHCYKDHPDQRIAESAVMMADALIEALNKTEKK